MGLLLFSRHAESTLNVEGRVNGDPGVHVVLTPTGEDEARRLGIQVAHVPIHLCVHTRFSRTRQTAELALAGRGVPFEEEPLLDDIKVGDLEGQTIGDYRAWKAEHTRADAFPGGESLNDAARRYATAFERLANSAVGRTVLIVCHEIPIRYAVNAASGSEHLDGPVHDIANATPFIFTEDALDRAARHATALAEST